MGLMAGGNSAHAAHAEHVISLRRGTSRNRSRHFVLHPIGVSPEIAPTRRTYSVYVCVCVCVYEVGDYKKCEKRFYIDTYNTNQLNNTHVKSI